jgi:hypothetical protein
MTKGLWTTAATLLLVPIMSALLGAGMAAQTPGPRLALGGLEKLKAAAAETVDLSLDGTLLSLAARFMSNDDPDTARIKALVGGLKGVYVRSFEFTADNAFGAADVENVRRQFGPGWSRMAGVHSTRDNADVDVYLWLDGDTVGGLGILSLEPRRFTVVNIVGAIDLDQLRRLEGLGLPRLDLERGNDAPGREKARKGKPARDKGLKDKALKAPANADGADANVAVEPPATADVGAAAVVY